MWEQMSSQKNRLNTSTSDPGMGTVGPTSSMKEAMSTGEREVLQLPEDTREVHCVGLSLWEGCDDVCWIVDSAVVTTDGLDVDTENTGVSEGGGA